MSWSTSELRVRLVQLNMFKPSSNLFTDHSEALLLLWILFAIVLNFLCCLVCSLQPCGHHSGLTSWLSGVGCFLVFLSLSHMVSWVRYLMVSIPDLCLLLNLANSADWWNAVFNWLFLNKGHIQAWLSTPPLLVVTKLWQYHPMKILVYNLPYPPSALGRANGIPI